MNVKSDESCIANPKSGISDFRLETGLVQFQNFTHAPPPKKPRIPLFFLLFALALAAVACAVGPAIKSAHPLRLRMRSDRETSSLDSPVVIVLTACSYWFGTVRKIFRRMTFSIWESGMGLRFSNRFRI